MSSDTGTESEFEQRGLAEIQKRNAPHKYATMQDDIYRKRYQSVKKNKYPKWVVALFYVVLFVLFVGGINILFPR